METEATTSDANETDFEALLVISADTPELDLDRGLDTARLEEERDLLLPDSLPEQAGCVSGVSDTAKAASLLRTSKSISKLLADNGKERSSI